MKSENKVSDQKILAEVLYRFYNEIEKNQHPINFYDNLKATVGDIKNPDTYKKYVESMFASTIFLNDTRWKAFVANPDGVTLQNDPAYACVTAFLKNYQSKYLTQYEQFTVKNNELGRVYLKGIRQSDTAKAKKMYPDATFTMRVSFGNVKNYNPRDAVKYDYITTMSGVLEKYIAGDYEFDLPSSMLELARKKDFGPYGDPVRKDLVVGFITTTDITGGNSGSPVIDANGNLIGLAFDGNYEALSHQISFDKNLCRTINVDIRYVLWCIDKLGGATNIIKELKLVK